MRRFVMNTNATIEIVFWLSNRGDVTRRMLSALGLAFGVTACACSSEPDCPTPAPYCVSGCNSDAVYPAQCSNGAWTCEDGKKLATECPPDSCFTTPTSSCCDADGGAHPPICPGHAGMTCAAGETLLTTMGGPCDKRLCGSTYCAQLSEYCRVTLHDGGSEAAECVVLPQDCGSSPDCACLASDPCATSCDDSVHGALRVTCDG
jgi:hypothetical protein